MSQIATLERDTRIAHAAKVGAPAPTGPTLDAWNSMTLAQALEHECERASQQGLAKVSLHMDIQDAVQLASVLRRAALRG